MNSGTVALTPDVTVAVIGAGTMGSGIAAVATAAGHPVPMMGRRSSCLR